MKSCFFIGHREASSEILPALQNAVEQHIVEYGVTEFIVGHYGGFDRLAARAVIDSFMSRLLPSWDICSQNTKKKAINKSGSVWRILKENIF